MSFYIEELTERERDRQIDGQREASTATTDWADGVTELANEVLVALGFSGNTQRLSNSMGMLASWDALSGSITFTASYSYGKGEAATLRRKFPRMTHIDDHINNRLNDLMDQMLAIQRPWMYRLCFDVTASGGFGTRDNSVGGIINDNTGDEPYANLDCRAAVDKMAILDGQLQEWVDDVVGLVGRLFADEYEWVTSDEYQLDMLDDVEFDENGVDDDEYAEGLPSYVSVALVPGDWRWRRTPAGETLATWAAKQGGDFSVRLDELAIMAYDPTESDRAFPLATTTGGLLFELPGDPQVVGRSESTVLQLLALFEQIRGGRYAQDHVAA